MKTYLFTKNKKQFFKYCNDDAAAMRALTYLEAGWMFEECPNDIQNMSLQQLQFEKKNLIEIEERITNNSNGWVHPDTERRAKVEYISNRKEIDVINLRIAELEN